MRKFILLVVFFELIAIIFLLSGALPIVSDVLDGAISSLKTIELDTIIFKDQQRYSTPYSCVDCNVILVTFDSLRADRLGVYGYEKDITPQIDSFAKKSFVFTDVLSQCGSTHCSMVSMHTSKFPYVDSLLEDEFFLNPDEITIAEVFKEHGYSTFAVVSNKPVRSKYGISQGFDIFDENFTPYEESAYRTKSRAMNILRNRSEKPFFLWIHFLQPHGPYNPSEETFKELYLTSNNEPTFYSPYSENYVEDDTLEDEIKTLFLYYPALPMLLDYYSEKESLEEYIFGGKSINLTPTIVAQFRAMYDGGILEVDKEFGGLIDYIDESGLSDNTIVIVASDHGESLGERNVIDHNSLYYKVLNTPLIFHVPSNEHEIIDYPVMNVDIFPTILRILGIEIEHQIRGEDLLSGNKASDLQFAEYSKIYQTIRMGNYKLIISPSDIKLFNIIEDPEENNNIITYHLDVYRELMQVLEGFNQI